MEKMTLKISRISEGLEYGEGKIAAQVIPAETRQVVDECIETNPNIIVPVDIDDNGNAVDDDGCGDGRGVKLIKKAGKILKHSLNRAKVFGGAVAMTAGIWIGEGRAEGLTLEEVFHGVIGELDEANVNYGAHTADHVAPGREDIDSGCGAIDAAPQIVQAVVKFEAPIAATLKHLGMDFPGIDTIFGNYRAYAATVGARSEYSGKRVMQGITDADKVVKELEGPHLECRILLNTVKGYTVNQQLIREVSGGKAQVFAVDVWRLEEIGTAMYPDDETARQTAIMSALVYTLGVAGVLTPGDLPVYLIEQSPPQDVA